ncbi:helix-turn-helix domain-containing protein [Dactylosporangium sp. CA-233914]|uniref:helix-turn-helix domain-containing protein n=1 Tax=Dactylosporangium sp. CA-233914 TaxID=3239934 RepID=UPI003D92A5AA
MAAPADGERWDAPHLAQEMARLYLDERLSIRRVAKRMGCSYGTAHHVLHASGVTIRPRRRPRAAETTATGPAAATARRANDE